MDGSFFWHMITAVFANWYDAKMVIERAGTVSTDALHVIAGMLVQLLVALLLRRPLSAWLPWLAVLAALLFNEAVDLWVERWPSLPMQLTESIKDLVLTLLLPTALMVALRVSPGLGAARRP
jgi:TRAP-type uncharacterized transport system fused permease subunit